MSTTTIFEISPIAGGFRPSATISWGSGRPGATGPLCFETFATEEAAQRWCAVQFSIPGDAWVLDEGRLRAVRAINAGITDWKSVGARRPKA